MHRIFLAIAIVCLASSAALAQDPAKVDPKHYKVLMENDQVRVLHIHYGPHEKSVMHYHPATVAVFLSSGNGRFTFPDGKTQDLNFKLGDAQYSTATTHLPENTGDQAFDVVVIELKGQPAKSTKVATPK